MVVGGIFLSLEIGDNMKVLDLMCNERYRWYNDHVAHFFGPDLANRVLSIAIPTHDTQDVRV